jgi:predicted small secreted protein
MNILKKIMIVSIVLSTLGLSACGTVNGFGRDVSHVGRDIQRASH